MVFVLPNGSNGDECRWRRAHDLAPECREPGVTPSPPPGICLLSLRVLQHAAFNINLTERGCAVASACRVTCGGELLRPGHAGSHPNSQRKQNKKFPHCRPRGEVYQQPELRRNCGFNSPSMGLPAVLKLRCDRGRRRDRLLGDVSCHSQTHQIFLRISRSYVAF
jgi:hypothetical protein